MQMYLVIEGIEHLMCPVNKKEFDCIVGNEFDLLGVPMFWCVDTFDIWPQPAYLEYEPYLSFSRG